MTPERAVARARTIVELARAWETGWAAGDLAGLMALSGDVRYEDPLLPRPLQGRAEVSDYFMEIMRALKDPIIRLEQVFTGADGEHAAQWLLEGILLGPVPQGLAPTGDRISIRGIAQVKVSDGAVSEVRQFPDYVSFQRQIGAAPRPGSRGDRLLRRLQALMAHRRLRRNLRALSTPTPEAPAQSGDLAQARESIPAHRGRRRR